MAISNLTVRLLSSLLDEADLTVEELRLVCCHQPSLPFLEVQKQWLGLKPNQLITTVTDHGNVGAATVPLQLALARESGALSSGDHYALAGAASGVSAAVMVGRW